MNIDSAHILLIEDNQALAENVVEILEFKGCRVVHAATGAEAHAAALAGFDVALVDVNLPDVTGIQLLSELRCADELCEIILVTGNASVEDAIRAVQGGAYDYIVKPFQIEELLSIVERAYRQVSASRSASRLAMQVSHREEKLRTLVDTVQALLLVLDEHGRVLQANPAVEAVTGASEAELRGMHWQRHFVPKSAQQGTQDVVARILAGESRVAHENPIVSRDGRSQRTIQWLSSGLEQPDGTMHIYASGLDVTEVRDLERRTHLAEKLAAVGTLSAGLAHEIRNPLNSAQLQLRLLQRRLSKQSSDPVLFRPIELVQGEIQRLSDLVQEFLNFARPSELKLAATDIAALVRDVVALARPGATEHDVTLIESYEDGVSGQIDPGKIKQVVLNLLRNAIEAASPDGQVQVQVQARAEVAVLRIADNGPGMTEEVIQHIFEPFFSTKATGTGLGMAICHSLITQHRGDIRVQSDARGAVITVELPVC